MRHELHLTLKGLRACLAALVPLLLAGLVVHGGSGAASVAVGGAIVVGNQLVAAMSTAWARTITPNVLAVGYAVFVFRMFAVFGAFAVAAQLPWVHKGLVAVAFCVSLAVSLGAEWVSYVRKSYVPGWRVSR